MANKGLQGFPTKHAIIQVVTGILGVAVDPRYALPETNSSPKLGHPKRKFIFQPSIFRGELFVSGRVSYTIPLIAAFQLKNHRVAFLLAEWYMRLVKKTLLIMIQSKMGPYKMSFLECRVIFYFHKVGPYQL